MDIKQIMEIIPHRYPFLLIDKILELDPLKSAVAQKNVTLNEWYFQGHFPNEPVMPGVLILEAMAQTGACAVLAHPDYKGKIAYFGAINDVKFRDKVLPGDTLVLECEIVKLKSTAGIGKGIASVNGKKVAEATLTFMIA